MSSCARAVFLSAVLTVAIGAAVSTLTYAQTSPPPGDASALFAEIERYASQTEHYLDQPIVVDYGDELTQELADLLRDYRNVYYTTISLEYAPPSGAIVVIRPEQLRNLSLGGDYEKPLAFGSVLAIFPRGVPTAPVGPTVRTDGTQLVIGGQGIAPGQLDGPSGVALDSVGNIYVADTNNNRVEKYDAQGNFLAAVGGYKSSVTMNQPWSTAVSSDGTVFVANTWNHQILKFDKDLKKIQEWGSGGQVDAGGDPFKLFGPRGIALSPDGHVLIVDSGNNRVIEYQGDGTFVRQFGTKDTEGGPTQYNEPSSLTIAPNGDIYIADFWNKRIVHLDKNLASKGEIRVDSWGSQQVLERAYIALLSDGRLLATDPSNGKILIFGADGAPLAEYAIPKEPNQMAARPIGIATDGTNVVVVDSIGNVVRKIPLKEILPQTQEDPPSPKATDRTTSSGGSDNGATRALGLIAVGVGLFALAAAVVFVGLRRPRGGKGEV